jgi:hypothetical protein
MYRPSLGRFLSPDPLGLVDGTNRFAFVGASPLSLRDPSGLCSQDPSLVCTNYDPTGNPDAEGLAINAGIAGAHWDDQMHAFHAGRAAQEAAAEQRRVDDIHAAGRYFRRVYNVVTTSLTVATSAFVCATNPAACVRGAVKSLVFASLTSSGGFEGMGMVVGVIGGAVNLGRGAVVADAAAIDVAEADVVSVAADAPAAVAPPAEPSAYSVAYETQLDPTDFGRSRAVHFNRANAALDADLKADPAFRETMERLIPGISDDVSAIGGRKTPAGWIWHHDLGAGVMQLVPVVQHTPGSLWWRILHPLPGAAGGYSAWALPAGAP